MGKKKDAEMMQTLHSRKELKRIIKVAKMALKGKKVRERGDL